MTKLVPGSTHVLKNNQGGRLFVVHKVYDSSHLPITQRTFDGWVVEKASLPSQQKYADMTPEPPSHLIICKDAAMANRVMLELKATHEDAEKRIQQIQQERRLRYEATYARAAAGLI